jgi:hypothetical protein
VVGEIVATLRRNVLVRSLDIIDLVEEESVQFLRARADLVDGSVLHVRELLFPDHSKYSYQWQATSGETLIRWDNAAHHPELPTHPYHKHVGADVVGSIRVSIEDVLDEIGVQLRTPC